jgi:thiamine biosynthesis lipoprotein
VLAAARAVAEASDGRFDVSVAPELVRYGYLPRHAGLARPAPGANWQHIELLPGHRVQLARPLHLDLGGIAKGYAVDCAIGALQDAGMDAGRVNAGGDLRLFGDAAEPVHVRHPQTATCLLPLCQLSEGAVATSATYYSGRRVRGRPVSPLIDAATRQPCAGARSVSVLADRCTLADALTKVVYADPAQALAALQRFAVHLPDSLPSSLKALDARHTKITTLPTLPDSLEYIDVRFTSLTEETIERLKAFAVSHPLAIIHRDHSL